MDREDKEKLLKALRAKQKIAEDSNLKNFIPTPLQRAFLLSQAKVRMPMGANRSGKTECCAVEIGIRTTGVIPDALRDVYPMKMIQAGEYWASSKTNKFAYVVGRQKLANYLPKREVARFHENRNMFFLKNGNKISLKSEQEGYISYDGASCPGIWLDEEHSEKVYKACHMRTIDCEGKITMSFSPIEGFTWAFKGPYSRAKKRYYTVNKHGIAEGVGLVHTPEEIDKLKDRELRCDINPSKEADDDYEIYVFTMYDNPYLPSAEVHRAEKENRHDMAQYQARVLGKFAKLQGNQVYPAEVINRGAENCPKEWERGNIVDGRFELHKEGDLLLFKRPEAGHSYVVSGDCSEGLEDGDFSCAQILDHVTLEQVGIWHGKISPEKFALVLIDIGRYFNTAWLIPESNFHGYGVVKKIRDKKYPFIYIDDDESLRIDAKHEQTKYGWNTNKKTKPIMVQTLGDYLCEEHIKINDINTWDELMTFIYNADRQTGAIKGCYDDRAIAIMIALQCAIKKRPTGSRRTMSAPARPRHIDPYTGY